MLKKRLPPLNPLIVFEAAARLLSFTHAGEELHLTQAAISQHIRNLEDSLQVRLFTRSHRAVQLTNEGHEFHHRVATILKQLAGATTDIKNSELSQKLTIGCDQSFAMCWLSPRLKQLQQFMPDAALRVVTSDNERECLANHLQVSVIHGDGQWPGFHSIRLFDEEVFPVCAPTYDYASARDDWVGWILLTELIELEYGHWNWMNWRLWFEGSGIHDPIRPRNLQLNNYLLVIEAARRGQGVALGWSCLVDDLIEQGELLRPIEQTLKTRFGYYLVYRESYEDDIVVMQFRNWLLEQFKIDTEAL